MRKVKVGGGFMGHDICRQSATVVAATIMLAENCNFELETGPKVCFAEYLSKFDQFLKRRGADHLG